MKCQKCNEEFSENSWKNGETYVAIDKHHNPPEFLMERWKGEIYNLCRKCHRKLHDKIITLMNKKTNTPKFIKSEYWVMQRMTPDQIEESCSEIYKFTKKWIE